jgi:hypothetical protein
MTLTLPWIDDYSVVMKPYFRDKIVPGLIAGVIGGFFTVLLTASLLYFLPSVIAAYRENFKNEVIKAGYDGLTERFKGLDTGIALANHDIRITQERLVKIETTVQNIEKYLLRDLKPRAVKLLGTPNVDLSLVSLKPNSTFQTSFYVGDVGPFILTYKVQGITKDSIALITESNKTQDIQGVQKVDLPFETRQPVTLTVRVTINGRLTPYQVRIMIIDRPTRETLVLASAITEKPIS